jgi:hypothetical protein
MLLASLELSWRSFEMVDMNDLPLNKRLMEHHGEWGMGVVVVRVELGCRSSLYTSGVRTGLSLRDD